MKPLSNSRMLVAAAYAAAAVFATLVFFLNILGTASELQFRTYRDGSEALVLGKVFADREDIDIDRANLAFIEKDAMTRSSDVLAVYYRLDHRNGLQPANVTDQNWNGGVATFDRIFLLPRTAIARLGYASNEVAIGQQVLFADGERRTITGTELNDQYLLAHYSGEALDGRRTGFPHLIGLLRETDRARYVFEPYKAQYGLQGIAFSWLFRMAGELSSVALLQAMAAILFALTMTALTYEYAVSVSGGFAIALFVSMIGSPWVVSIVRNLYWATFLWILPALVAMWIYRYRGGLAGRAALYSAFFLAVLMKSLCGYEYLPTILIFSLAIFAVAPFAPNSPIGYRTATRTAAHLFGLGIAAFVCALLLHASIRADTILQGLAATYRIDAFKYSPIAGAGITAMGQGTSLPSVLYRYVFEWSTPVLFFGNSPWVFPSLLAIGLLSLASQYAVRNPYRNRDAALLLVTLAAPCSWFILMKGHSAIHTHLNYVLWYFGFVSALLFVGIRGFGTLWQWNRRPTQHT